MIRCEPFVPIANSSWCFIFILSYWFVERNHEDCIKHKKIMFSFVTNTARLQNIKFMPYWTLCHFSRYTPIFFSAPSLLKTASSKQLHQFKCHHHRNLIILTSDILPHFASLLLYSKAVAPSQPNIIFASAFFSHTASGSNIIKFCIFFPRN